MIYFVWQSMFDIDTCSFLSEICDIIYFAVSIIYGHNFLTKKVDFFLFLHKNICLCGAPLMNNWNMFLCWNNFIWTNVYKAKTVHHTSWKAGCKILKLITKTCLYDFDPFKPHLSIIKLGFTGVYIIFSYFCWKQRLWVLVRTASSRRF